MSLVPLRSVKAFHSSSFPWFPNMTYRDILLVNKGFSSRLLPWVPSAVFTSLQELLLVEGWSSPRSACGRRHLNEELLIVLVEQNKPVISSWVSTVCCALGRRIAQVWCFLPLQMPLGWLVDHFRWRGDDSYEGSDNFWPLNIVFG